MIASADGLIHGSAAETFGLVDAFVRKHRERLVTNVDQLASIATTLDEQRRYLDELLALTPVGFNNLMRTWDADNQAVRARPNLDRLFGELFGHFGPAGAQEPRGARFRRIRVADSDDGVVEAGDRITHAVQNTLSGLGTG